MRYEYSPKYKKRTKKVAQIVQKVRTAHKMLTNPLKAAGEIAIDRLANMDTKRKSRGYIGNRDQVYNPKTQRFVKRDRKTGKFIQCSSRRNRPYANVAYHKRKSRKK